MGRTALPERRHHTSQPKGKVLHTSTDYLLLGEASGPQAMDRLATLTRNISPRMCDLLADIFTLMLPMLKND